MNRSVRLQPPREPINLTYKLNGSKSYSNRALLIAALADGESVLTNVSISDDTSIFI